MLNHGMGYLMFPEEFFCYLPEAVIVFISSSGGIAYEYNFKILKILACHRIQGHAECLFRVEHGNIHRHKNFFLYFFSEYAHGNIMQFMATNEQTKN